MNSISEAWSVLKSDEMVRKKAISVGFAVAALITVAAFLLTARPLFALFMGVSMGVLLVIPGVLGQSRDRGDGSGGRAVEPATEMLRPNRPGTIARRLPGALQNAWMQAILLGLIFGTVRVLAEMRQGHGFGDAVSRAALVTTAFTAAVRIMLFAREKKAEEQRKRRR